MGPDGFRVSALRRMKGGPMLQVLELHRRSHWLTSNVAGGAHQLLVRFWHSELGHWTYLRNMCIEVWKVEQSDGVWHNWVRKCLECVCH